MSKPFRDGPEYVGNAAANLYNPATGVTAYVRHIHLTNKDSSPRTVTLYLGASGASVGGTEILKDKTIAVGDTYDAYYPAGLPVVGGTDYIVAVASAANAIVATTTGELEVT